MSNNEANTEIPAEETTPLQTGLIVLHALTAELNRVKSTTVTGFRLGSNWDLENDIANQFIQSIETKFKRRNKLYSYLAPKENDGTETESIKMANRLSLYLSNEKPSISDFNTFATTTMTALTLAANETKSRFTPSNIVFIHYKREEDDTGRILFVMLKHKGVYKFDENLLPVEEESIDTDALLQAASIEGNLFQTTYPENDSEPYLSFIKGDSSSEFFQQALGCSVIANNLDSTKALHIGLRAFLSEMPTSVRDNIIEVVSNHLDEVARSKTKIAHLDEIQTKIDALIPASHAEKRGQFCVFLNENEYKVNESFSPTTKGNNVARRITFQDGAKNYTCDILYESIGPADSDKPVKITEDGQYILVPINDTLSSAEVANITKKE